MIQHGALSIIAEIRQSMKVKLLDLFKQMEANDVDSNMVVPFQEITSIHFARFVVLNESITSDGKIYPAKLVFTSNYDLPLESHLNELADKAGKGLWTIFSMCVGFPQNESFSKQVLLRYLESHKVKTNTFYVGVGQRSVLQIRNESKLRESIETFADELQKTSNDKNAVSIRKQIIDYVNSRPEFEWAKKPAPEISFGSKIAFYGKLWLVVLIGLAFSPIIIPFLIIWWLMIFFIEIREENVPNVVSKDHLRELVNRETGMVQTQFSAYGEVKPGKIRLLTMLFLLKLTDFLAPYLFSKGKLSGIPTVHFARWIILDKGRHMLFLSNFDGLSEGYLRDFINIAAKQLTLMFCHTVGYPKTRLMVFGGAKDAKGFMEWARKKQTITNIWYSANKNLTVKNIYTNSAIRKGLYGVMNEQEACKWLKKL